MYFHDLGAKIHEKSYLLKSVGFLLKLGHCSGAEVEEYSVPQIIGYYLLFHGILCGQVKNPAIFKNNGKYSRHVFIPAR